VEDNIAVPEVDTEATEQPDSEDKSKPDPAPKPETHKYVEPDDGVLSGVTITKLVGGAVNSAEP
jgi:hypothetical protein